MKNSDEELDRKVEDFLRAEEKVSAFDPPEKQWAREIVYNQNRSSKVCGVPLAWVLPLAACFILVLFYNVDFGDGRTGSLDSAVVQMSSELSPEDLVLVEDFLAEADFFHEINRLDLDDTMDLLVLLEPIP
tara:strand:+ start:245 stop:637 length:393 start_codon:yes stop_codon:yes gene_type:complete